MANVAKQAILRAKLAGILTDLLPKTVTDNVYVNETTTLTVFLATLAAKADLQTLQNSLGALASKDKVSASDLDEALYTLIYGTVLEEEFNEYQIAVREALALRDERIDDNKLKIETLIGSDTNKSVRTIANEELAKQLIAEGADASLDTLAEIAAWIQEHPDDAAAMNQAITALQNQLKGIAAGEGTVKKYVDDAIAALKIGDYAKAADLTTLAERVTTVEQNYEDLGTLAHLDTVSVDDLEKSLKEKVATWDGKATFYCSATEPAGMVDGDIWAQIVE